MTASVTVKRASDQLCPLFAESCCLPGLAY